MTIKFLLVPWLIVMSLPAFAELTSEQQLAHCGREKNDNQRLKCYDRLYQQVSSSIAAKNPASINSNFNGNWTIAISPSLLTDNYNIELQLQAEYPVTSRTQTVKPTLELSCKEGKSMVAINWAVYLGKNRTKMTTRIDHQTADSNDWIIKDKYRVYSQTDNQRLINKLKQSDSIVAQISPYNAEPITAIFKLAGLKQQLEEYPLSCDW